MVDKSRMNREVHVRFREDVGVKFPHVTRLLRFQRLRKLLFEDDTFFFPSSIGQVGSGKISSPVEV